ncbi:MAG: S8 family peptidase [Bacillus sp. (in: firmicutes)]
MKCEMHLFPYQAEEITETETSIPGGIELIQAPAVWDKTEGEGITVAVLDTGCDDSHPDLKERVKGGRNFTNDDRGNQDIYMDYNGHGTHVAGTIAATKDGTGVTGAAPKADLLIVKVLNKNGSGQYAWIIKGIEYAIEQKVDIISMSLGGPQDVPELHKAIQKATREGILVVCAAGNDGDGDDTTDELAYPGCYNEVISVGAVDLQRRSSRFTNSHNELDLVAPGEKIKSTYLGGKYASLSGTSMATPHVSGALALIKNMANKSFGRTLTEPELYAQLIKRTVPLPYSQQLTGNGILYLTVEEILKEMFSKEAGEVSV